MAHVFQIGDIAISTFTTGQKATQHRFKGQKYLVRDVMYCPKSGKQYVNFGFKCDPQYKRCRCHYCGDPHENRGLEWTPTEGRLVSEKEWDELCKIPADLKDLVGDLGKELT